MTRVNLLVLFLILNLFNSFSQRHTAKYIIPDSVISLKKGIYMNLDEFLNNDPSITYMFDVININPDYYINPEERNEYLVTYYDSFGKKITLNMGKIWGYYNGFGVFINYNGKPYELIYLGKISILRYEHHYDKNFAAQAISLFAVGGTTTGIDKINDLYLDLENGVKYPRKDRYFKILIAKDRDFYNLYISDKKTAKIIKSQ